MTIARPKRVREGRREQKYTKIDHVYFLFSVVADRRDMVKLQ